MNELSPPLTRELDGLIHNGLDKRLMWIVGTMLTYVTVTDLSNGNQEHLFEVPEGENALEVFRNPFRFDEVKNGVS